MQIDRASCRLQIVREAMQLDCGPPADGKVAGEERLERDHDMLPGEGPARSLVDASGGLAQPARLDVLRAQTGRIAVARHPA